jgi:sugar transferase (PEP-CTERM/EpsH1 system associated)
VKHLRPQLLYLVHRIPYPPNRGDRIRTFHILDFLSRRGDVHLVTLADEPVSNETMQALQSRCKTVAVEQLRKSRWLRGAVSLLCGRSATEGLFWSRRLQKSVRTMACAVSFDAIVVSCSSMGQYLSLPELRDIPTIVDLIDVDSEKWFQYGEAAATIKRQLYKLEGRRLRNLERSLTERASAIVVVSEAEAALWRRAFSNDRTHAIPNGVDLDYFRPASGNGRPGRCVFVGALDYPPNVDGVCWFASHVWPEVRRRYPEATFAIVGRNPHSDVRSLSEIPGIEVIGPVPDVRPHLAEASVAVAPLRIARGIQNKILEAMACNRPVVASPQASEGLGVERKRPFEVADTPAQWVDAVLYLLTDQSARSRLALAGRRYVEQHHVWHECLGGLEDLIEGCIARSLTGTSLGPAAGATSAASAIV